MEIQGYYFRCLFRFFVLRLALKVPTTCAQVWTSLLRAMENPRINGHIAKLNEPLVDLRRFQKCHEPVKIVLNVKGLEQKMEILR